MREPLDIASLIEGEPGVSVRRLGGDESAASLSIRGAASSQVGTVLAGIPLTYAADPSLDIASLPLFPGASVRVYRSFAPALLGTSGYLGGVLVLDPPSLARGARTESWVALGSFGSQKLRIADIRRVGSTTFASSLSASRGDGDFGYFADEPAHPNGGRTKRRANASHVAVSGIERVETDFGWGTVSAMVLGQAREQGLPGPARYATRFARLDSSRLGAAADVVLRTGDPESDDGVGIGAFRIAAHGVEERSRFRDPQGEIDPTRRGIRTDDSIALVGGSASYRGIVARGLVVDGIVDAKNERWQPGGTNRTARSPSASRTSLGLGGDAEWKLGRLTLAMTLRGDWRSDRIQDGGGTEAFSTTGHGGFDLVLTPWLSFASHAGWLSRPASFVELYGDRGGVVGNPKLGPEEATTVDAGFRGRLRAGLFKLGYEANAFWTEARHLITFVPHGRSALRADNLDRARLLGTELALLAQSGPALARIAYTAMLTRNEGDDALERGKPLPGRPAHDLALDTTWTTGPLSLRYSLDVVAGTTMDPKATILLPPRALHGIGASVLAIKKPELTLSARVDNLFDQRIAPIDSPATGLPVPMAISDLLGYPLPGRSLWVLAKVSVK